MTKLARQSTMKTIAEWAAEHVDECRLEGTLPSWPQFFAIIIGNAFDAGVAAGVKVGQHDPLVFTDLATSNDGVLAVLDGESGLQDMWVRDGADGEEWVLQAPSYYGGRETRATWTYLLEDFGPLVACLSPESSDPA